MRCDTHRQFDARYYCDICKSHLCSACVRPAGTMGAMCLKCKNPVAELEDPESRDTLGAAIRDLPAYPFRGRGWLIQLAGAMLLASIWQVPVVGPLTVGFLAMAYLCQALRRTAYGEDELPGVASFKEPWKDFLGPLVRFPVAGWPLWLPTGLYLLQGLGLIGEQSFSSVGGRMVWPESPLLITLIFLGLIYLPMALTLASLEPPWSVLINPVRGARWVVQRPARYLIATVVALVLVIGGLALASVLATLPALRAIPVVGHFLGALAGGLMVVLGIRSLGRIFAAELSQAEDW